MNAAPNPLPGRLSDGELLRWLLEDAPHGDLTTRALGIARAPAQMQFRARDAMRVALIEETARLIELAAQSSGGQAQVTVHQPGGSDAAAGELLLSTHGPADALLLAWKVAQTTVETASGIASAAAEILARVRAAGFAELRWPARARPGRVAAHWRCARWRRAAR